MSEQATAGTRPVDRQQAEGFSAWWWLGLPVGVFVLLSALSWLAPAISATWIEGELGLLELAQIVILLASLVVAVRILGIPSVLRRPLLATWVAIAALACLYIAGEEASWGQHIFNWSTPETWSEVNDQEETNLHNVSSWLDQKPRTLLEIGVVVGGILLPLAALVRPSIRRWSLAVILPPFLCLPSAVLAEVSRLTERLANATGSEQQLFTRASEVQELYFYLFILFYLIVLRQRLADGDRLLQS